MLGFFKFFNDEFKSSPLVLCDVGARGGMQEHWKKFEEYLKVVMVEPEPQAYNDLLKTIDPNKQVVIGTALHSQQKTIKLNITKSAGCSSLYEPNTDFVSGFPESDDYKVVKTQSIPADTLDAQLSKRDIHLDFLKVDTQGSELDILKSARESLTQDIFGIELEVEFTPLYKQQPLFAEVDQYVRSLGFQLFDLRPTYWKRNKHFAYGGPKGQLIFADALYFKTEHSFARQLKQREPQEQKGRVVRAIAQACVYGYLDYAATIFDQHVELFNEKEKKFFLNFLNKHKGMYHLIPHVRGRFFMASLVDKLSRAICPSQRGWATAVKNLGNR